MSSPEPAYTVVSSRLAKELRARLKAAARQNDRSLSAEVRTAIRDYLDRLPREAGR